MLQPPSCVLGFSQWCLVHEWLLVVFLMRGGEVRNDLYCPIGDINLPIVYILGKIIFHVVNSTKSVLHLKRIPENVNKHQVFILFFCNSLHLSTKFIKITFR